MWYNNCYQGVHVIKRYVDEWTYSDLDQRMRQVVGSQKTVIVWAISGSCPKSYPPNSNIPRINTTLDDEI